MAFTIGHFLVSILILSLSILALVLIYFLGLFLFNSYCKFDDVPNKSEVEIIIYDVLEKERKRTNSNSSNALKSKKK